MDKKEIHLSTIAEVASKCLEPEPKKEQVELIVQAVIDTLGSYLARGNSVTIQRLGKFYLNDHGNIKFTSSKTFRNRLKEIKAKIGA